MQISCETCTIFKNTFSTEHLRWRFYSTQWTLCNLFTCFAWSISKFSEMHSGNLSQIALPNMWLLVQIFRLQKITEYIYVMKRFHLVFLVARTYRSSQRRCFKKGVLKNFPNFTRKHLCWSLFLIKLQALLPSQICEIFKKTYLEEHLRATAFQLSSYHVHVLTKACQYTVPFFLKHRFFLFDFIMFCHKQKGHY